MIDWHTHILPSMDDGSESLEESAAMLECCRSMGVKAVVLTPHFYPHKEDPEGFLERRSRSLGRLKAYLDKAVRFEEGLSYWPTLIPAAEVYFFPELAVLDEDRLRALCIGGSPYLMLELPVEPWGDRIYTTLEAMICNRRIIPVLAHIDRYFPHIKDTEPLQALVSMGMLVQLNVEALEGFFSRRKALKWINSGMIHLLASDCHSLSKRPPNMDQGRNLLQRHLSSKLVNKLVSTDPKEKVFDN